ncbi:MAG: hypothetical protein GXP01_09955 [Alphaproteobacteria bacterium]|nr:hypothetical protein [Alphaproteobacteria bacterium]
MKTPGPIGLDADVRAAAPTVLVLLAFFVLVTYVPGLSIALPYAFMGPELILTR